MIRDVAIHRLLAGLGSSVPFSPDISIFQKREKKRKLPRYSGTNIPRDEGTDELCNKNISRVYTLLTN